MQCLDTAKENVFDLQLVQSKDIDSGDGEGSCPLSYQVFTSFSFYSGLSISIILCLSTYYCNEGLPHPHLLFIYHISQIICLLNISEP